MRQKRSVKRVVKRWKISNVTFPWGGATLNDDTFISFLDHGRLQSSNDRLLPDPGINSVQDQQAQTHLVKHVLQPLLRQCGALYIFDRPKLSREALSQLARYRSLLLSSQLLDHLAVVPQINLRPDDEARHAWTMMVYLWEPLLLDVFKGRRGGNAKADEKDVRLRV